MSFKTLSCYEICELFDGKEKKNVHKKLFKKHMYRIKLFLILKFIS